MSAPKGPTVDSMARALVEFRDALSAHDTAHKARLVAESDEEQARHRLNDARRVAKAHGIDTVAEARK